MQLDALLYIGKVDFASPTLLLLGNDLALRWLAEQIEARTEVRFEEQRDRAKLMNVILHLVPVETSEAMHECADHTLRWAVSDAEALTYAGQLRELAQASKPSHAYLDSLSSNIEVLASLGEYDVQKVFPDSARRS